MSPVYRCAACMWVGGQPSFSDASTLERVFVSDSSGGGWESRVVRKHIPVCPKCFTAVRSDLPSPAIPRSLVA